MSFLLHTHFKNWDIFQHWTFELFLLFFSLSIFIITSYNFYILLIYLTLNYNLSNSADVLPCKGDVCEVKFWCLINNIYWFNVLSVRYFTNTLQ